MKLENPILLPGKQLWAIHFDPLSCGRMTSELTWSELEPLFKTGLNRGWITSEEVQDIKKDFSLQKTESLWSKSKSWFTMLNPKEEKDSQALAGWLTLYNLFRYKNFIKSIRPPYTGLNSKDNWNLIQTLCKAIEIELLEKSKKEEAYRHFLGILLCDLSSSLPDWEVKSPISLGSEWKSLLKELLGKESFHQDSTQSNGQTWILTPSHGFLKENKWVQPSIEVIVPKTKELYKSFNFNKKDKLEKIKNTIDTYLS